MAHQNGVLVQPAQPFRVGDGGFEEDLEAKQIAAGPALAQGAGKVRRGGIEQREEIGRNRGRLAGGRHRGAQVTRGGDGRSRLDEGARTLRVDDAIVERLHFGEVLVKPLQQHRRREGDAWLRRRQTAGQQLQLALAGGQHMGLGIIGKLQPVLQGAEELIGARQYGILGDGKQFLIAQTSQGQQGAAMAHPQFAPAVQTLQALHQELNIANAAAFELDIEARLLAGLVAFGNPSARFGHGFDAGEIERGAIDHGLDKIEQDAAGFRLTGGHAALNQHLQLPVAGAAAVIGLGAFKRNHHFAMAAFGAQTKIDTVTDAGRRVSRKQLGEVAGQLGEKLLIAERLRAVGFAGAGVDKAEVDVGRVV